MVFGLPLVMAFVVASAAPAADFRGQWAGTATNPGGAAIPIYLTVSEQHGVVAGHLIRGESKEVPLSEAVIRGDELAFAVRDAFESPAKLAFKFVVFGHPLGDRQVMLRGTCDTGNQQCAIDLYPVAVHSPGMTGIDLTPMVVRRFEPVYPEEARRAGVQGTVRVHVEIEETGLISNEQVRLLSSPGYGLDQAAIKCVKQWLFRPAFRKGYAVRSSAIIEIPFRL